MVPRSGQKLRAWRRPDLLSRNGTALRRSSFAGPSYEGPFFYVIFVLNQALPGAWGNGTDGTNETYVTYEVELLTARNNLLSTFIRPICPILHSPAQHLARNAHYPLPITHYPLPITLPPDSIAVSIRRIIFLHFSILENHNHSTSLLSLCTIKSELPLLSGWSNATSGSGAK